MPKPAKPTKPAKPAFPFRVELSADDFHALLKHARPQSGVARRLSAAEDSHTTGGYVVAGYETEGLALRALALAHAPEVVAAIDKALKLARHGSKQR